MTVIDQIVLKEVRDKHGVEFDRESFYVDNRALVLPGVCSCFVFSGVHAGLQCSISAWSASSNSVSNTVHEENTMSKDKRI